MELTLRLSEEIIQAIKLPPERMERELLIELATGLYRRRVLSFGKAKQLAGVDYWKFAEELSERGITRDYTEEELEEDIEYAQSCGE